MDFCPNCKSILKVTGVSAALRCQKCGCQVEFNGKGGSDHKLNNDIREKNEIAVISRKESGLKTFPVVQFVCPECGKKVSETWTVAVGSEGRTSTLTFLRCISCGYTTRDTD